MKTKECLQKDKVYSFASQPVAYQGINLNEELVNCFMAKSRD